MTPSAAPHVPAERIRHTLQALLFATVACAGMLLARFVCTDDLRFRFAGFFGNLLLAWIPLLLALFIRRMPGRRNGFGFWGALTAWVLFFPNAFYITTDLIHMRKFGSDGIYQWFDMLMTASFVCGGLFLGSLSLYLLHLVVQQKLGRLAGWMFAVGMLALGSFGIYLGRFLRLNSWDVVTRPGKLVGDISGLLEPSSLTEVAAFSATFFCFSLVVYGFVVSMARLHDGSREG